MNLVGSSSRVDGWDCGCGREYTGASDGFIEGRWFGYGVGAVVEIVVGEKISSGLAYPDASSLVDLMVE